MKVEGIRLELAPDLVRRLKSMGCSEHSELAEVQLIVAQDGTATSSLYIPCCQKFRNEAQGVIDSHNTAQRS